GILGVAPSRLRLRATEAHGHHSLHSALWTWVRFDRATPLGLQTSSQWQKSLRQLRLRAGLTEQTLADRLGVTCHAIQAWERGQRAIRAGWDLKLAEALGCTVTDLIQAGSAARSERWRRALINLAQTPRPRDDAQ